MSAKGTITPVLLGCANCGNTLPIDAQFCVKCGKPVTIPKSDASAAQLDSSESSPRISLSKPRKRRIIPWIFFLLFLAFAAWSVLSENPFAQAIQEGLGWKHDNAILDSSFTLAPRGFRYYKFSLPEGSTNVAIIGEFSSAIAEPKRGSVSNKAVPSSQEPSHIEVLVVSESAFAVWQKGYATSSVYDSGQTTQAKLHEDLPAGAGVYYLLFSNKADATRAKAVTSTVLLRYKSWLPVWLRHLKED